MRDKIGVNPDRHGGGEELGEPEGGESIIRMYHVRTSSIFNKRERRRVLG